jgi:hypothetical protein
MASYEKQFVFPPSRAKRGAEILSVLEMSFWGRNLKAKIKRCYSAAYVLKRLQGYRCLVLKRPLTILR